MANDCSIITKEKCTYARCAYPCVADVNKIYRILKVVLYFVDLGIKNICKQGIYAHSGISFWDVILLCRAIWLIVSTSYLSPLVLQPFRVPEPSHFLRSTFSRHLRVSGLNVVCHILQFPSLIINHYNYNLGLKYSTMYLTFALSKLTKQAILDSMFCTDLERDANN